VLVRERMSTTPVTIVDGTPVTEALQLMRRRDVRRLPVLEPGTGRLVGIVSEKDLLYAAPSPATSLSIYELHYALAQLKVTEVMTTDLITVAPDVPLEEAARIMADHKIGGLPVMEDDRLVGIITQTDIFKVFLELLGGREKGIRLTIEIPERKGEISRITTAIAQLGGDIVALGTFLGDDPTTAVVTLKLKDQSIEVLQATMDCLGLQILDLREI